MKKIPTHTESGSERQVGVEIELTGLDIQTIAQLVQKTFGGQINPATDYEIVVASETMGEFRIEVDFALLKELGQNRTESEAEPGLISQISENLLAQFADRVAPCEIITAPLPFADIEKLDKLIVTLNQAGAKGTDDAIWYAFGVHFNPQAPNLRASGILAYLRAFLLLYDWLCDTLQIDISRRLTPFVDGFPSDYTEYVLAPGYTPDITTLIDDYLSYNPTRNRALDLLPLFAHIDEQRITDRLDDTLVNARPTYHYRLPNSRIGDSDWRLSTEWRSWLRLERLAQQPEIIADMAEDYLSAQASALPLSSQWLERTTQWLNRIDAL